MEALDSSRPNFAEAKGTAKQTDILLLGINAKYIHASFGLRYLFANLGAALQERTTILECDINQRMMDVAEQVLAHGPKIVGIGVYIWNVEAVTRLVGILKKIDPQLILVVGGPEVSFEWDQQSWLRDVDHLITGEADHAFRDLCRARLEAMDAPESILPARIIHAPLPDVQSLQLPYAFYQTEDLRHRIVYVEASRGCPFTCEFCLSSLDVPVRAFDLDSFLEAMDDLFQRGLRHFKFVDRTFNLNIKTGSRILQFFLDRYEPGLFLHFEMIPDRLPEALREIIARFPAGAVQFEIGIQTFNPQISENISRRQNLPKLEDNLRFLRSDTGVHLHVDLIAGLPGENLQSFGEGFDRLIALNPHEIQIGILKRLRGTPIVRHDTAYAMVYDAQAPYEILQNKDVSFEEIQRIKRFARYWDLVGNSGNFVESIALFWTGSTRFETPFDAFMDFSDWIYAQTGQRHGFALTRLLEWVFRYLTERLGVDRKLVSECLWRDYQRSGRSDKPLCLRPYLESISTEPQAADKKEDNKTPKHSQRSRRQSKHQPGLTNA